MFFCADKRCHTKSTHPHKNKKTTATSSATYQLSHIALAWEIRARGHFPRKPTPHGCRVCIPCSFRMGAVPFFSFLLVPTAVCQTPCSIAKTKGFHMALPRIFQGFICIICITTSYFTHCNFISFKFLGVTKHNTHPHTRTRFLCCANNGTMLLL